LQSVHAETKSSYISIATGVFFKLELFSIANCPLKGSSFSISIYSFQEKDIV